MRLKIAEESLEFKRKRRLRSNFHSFSQKFKRKFRMRLKIRENPLRDVREITNMRMMNIHLLQDEIFIILFSTVKRNYNSM